MLNKFYNVDDFFCTDEETTHLHLINTQVQTLDDWEKILAPLDTPLREILLPSYNGYLALSEKNTLESLWRDDSPLSFDFDQITEALEILDEHEKIIIHRFFWNGESIREIAEDLNIPKTTVTRIRNRSLERLKRYFKHTPPTNSETVPK